MNMRNIIALFLAFFCMSNVFAMKRSQSFDDQNPRKKPKISVSTDDNSFENIFEELTRKTYKDEIFTEEVNFILEGPHSGCDLANGLNAHNPSEIKLKIEDDSFKNGCRCGGRFCFAAITKAIQENSKLCHFSLEAEICSHDLEKLLSALENKKDLKGIEIMCDIVTEDKELCNVNYSYLAKILSSNHNLESITFQNQTDSKIFGLIELAKTLKAHRTLRHLALDLYNLSCENEEIKTAVFEALKYNVSLLRFETLSETFPSGEMEIKRNRYINSLPVLQKDLEKNVSFSKFDSCNLNVDKTDVRVFDILNYLKRNMLWRQIKPLFSAFTGRNFGQEYCIFAELPPELLREIIVLYLQCGFSSFYEDNAEPQVLDLDLSDEA